MGTRLAHTALGQAIHHVTAEDAIATVFPDSFAPAPAAATATAAASLALIQQEQPCHPCQQRNQSTSRRTLRKKSQPLAAIQDADSAWTHQIVDETAAVAGNATAKLPPPIARNRRRTQPPQGLTASTLARRPQNMTLGAESHKQRAAVAAVCSMVAERGGGNSCGCDDGTLSQPCSDSGRSRHVDKRAKAMAIDMGETDVPGDLPPPSTATQKRTRRQARARQLQLWKQRDLKEQREARQHRRHGGGETFQPPAAGRVPIVCFSHTVTAWPA